MSKFERLILRLHDLRADIDDRASEVDDPELNQAIHAVLDRHVRGGDEIALELDMELLTASLVPLEEDGTWARRRDG